jgi:hypothetical protein
MTSVGRNINILLLSTGAHRLTALCARHSLSIVTLERNGSSSTARVSGQCFDGPFDVHVDLANSGRFFRSLAG